MPGTDLLYNGVTLQNVLTRTFEQSVQYDDSSTDAIGQKTRIAVSAVVHNTPGVGIGATPQYGSSTTATYNAIKQKLLEPRCVLEMTVGGITLYSCNATTDINNGPKPQKVNVTQIAGTQLFRVDFEIECMQVDCGSNSNSSGVLNNRWSIEDSIGENWFCTRSIHGKLRVANVRFNPQSFRGWVVPPLQRGFQRQSMNFVTTPDGLTMEYTITDVQRAAAPPPPAINWTCTHTESTNDGVSSMTEIEIHLDGAPGCNKQQLITVAVQTADAITGRRQFDKSVKIESAAIIDSIHENSVDFRIRLKQTPQTPSDYYTANIDKMGLPLDGRLSGYDQYKWPAPADKDLASPTGMFICYLQSPCNDQHQVNQSNSLTRTGISDDRIETQITTATGTLPSTLAPAYSDEQRQAIYTFYTAESTYRTQENVLSLPVANSAASLAAGAPTRALINLAPPQAFRVVKVKAERHGEWPSINDPVKLLDDGSRLVGVNKLKSEGPVLSADGQNSIYYLEQTLTYSLPRPPGASQFRAAMVPWKKSEPNDAQIPASVFKLGIF